jgi:hypothetical protein
MAEEPSHEEKGQVERAQRIRAQIERLKPGSSKDEQPGKGKSIKEQLEDRAGRAEKSG